MHQRLVVLTAGLLLATSGCALLGKKSAPQATEAGAAAPADSAAGADASGASGSPAPADSGAAAKAADRSGDAPPKPESASAKSASPSAKSKKTAGKSDVKTKPEPPSGPVTITDVAKLKAMGPVYTPYDLGPVLVPGDWLSNLLQDTLVPVIEKYHLPPTTAAYYWVLLDAQGEVHDVVLHTTSENARFDQAARAAALHLHYLAAHRDGKRVPAWILVRVSLLMR